jgi:glycosyltransferase involved in cell wall biosynthesis
MAIPAENIATEHGDPAPANVTPTGAAAPANIATPRALRIAIALPGIHRVNRGAETAFEQIARELAALGHKVTVFGSGEARENTPYNYRNIRCVSRETFEKWPKLPCLRTHYAWEELTFSPGLWREYRPVDFDITIACSYPYMNWILRRGRGKHAGDGSDAKSGPKHIFITQNGDYMAQASNAEFRLFSCDGLVCTNAQYFERHRDRYPSAIIPNGVDPAVFHPGDGDRAAYGLPASEPIALMVSALISSKRVIEGVRAAAKVPGLFLVVAGDGECRDEVQAEADRLLPGRFKRVTLPREKMPGLYRCANLFLHMSCEEASANAYMEALATGLPIVTHDWEVTRWTLEDCAILVDATEIDAVAAGLSSALTASSPEQIAARIALVNRRFAWDSIAKAYSDFFEQIMTADAAGAELNPADAQPEPIVKPPQMLADVGVVAIGRNEGERLKRCLASAVGQVAAVVYVDSGSTDGSIDAARNLGADIVELDTRTPFNAARARNAGLNRLVQISPDVRYVQFVDGDCDIRAGWLERARNVLETRPEIAAVCGRRRERFPGKNIFHRMIDLEWDSPIGINKSCGGDAMMKIADVLAVGSFNPTVMAGEEPELCLRLRRAGHKILRVKAEMTWHDADINRISQWWRRETRTGYGALDVATRFGKEDGLFVGQVRSARIWGFAWPIAVFLFAIIGAITGSLLRISPLKMSAIFIAIPLLAWIRQWLKIAFDAFCRGRSIGISLVWAAYILVEKFPVMVGQWRWLREQSSGKRTALIEYKSPAEART